MFLLDSVVDDDDDEGGEATPDAVAPVFSLHAVAGVPIGNMLLLRVALGAASLVALVDTGSTHNFIAEDVANRTGLAMVRRGSPSVTVANGERVPCNSVAKLAAFSIDGEHFTADLFALALAGYDMVLGT